MQLNNNTCIFINSCDKTHDIASYFLKSYDKYIINNYFPIFIGINKKKHEKKYKYLRYIESPKSNWKKETLYQLDIIKKKYKFKYIILILDDFIFNQKTNLDSYLNLLEKTKNKEIKYLSFKTMNECFIVNTISNLKNKNEINMIRKDYPYYSSLQIAMWEVNYLENMLIKCKNIWNFERLRSKNDHYQVKKNIFYYRHVVEKGEWDYQAKNYIQKYIGKFDPGLRKTRKDFLGYQIVILKKFVFFIFGFLIMRLKGN